MTTMNGTLTRFDTNALAQLNRALVGFDRMFDTFESRFANQLATNYPPHNIVRKDQYNYYIEMAVAGFKKDEITVEVEGDQITIKGERKRDEDTDVQYIHRGLSARDFARQFQMAEHMIVKGAAIQDGILKIDLEFQIPEEKKARVIDIVEVK
jgi:molecular chaperone IbpA